MKPHTLGIDPGANGAAILLHPNGHTIVYGLAWKHKKATKKRDAHWETLNTGAGVGRFETMAGVGQELAGCAAAWCPGHYRMAVEGLFVQSRRGAITLAESAALVYGPCLHGAENAATLKDWRPMAKTWRSAMLGCANLKAKAAEDYAIRMAYEVFDGAGALEGHPHASEAAWIARWAWALD